MEITRVFVVGAGFMGSGIALAAASSGYQVMMFDLSGERLDAGVANIRRSLQKLLDRKKLPGKNMMPLWAALNSDGYWTGR